MEKYFLVIICVHSYNISGIDKTSLWWGKKLEQSLLEPEVTIKDHKGNFQGEGNIIYLIWGNGYKSNIYICQTHQTTHKSICKLYLNYVCTDWVCKLYPNKDDVKKFADHNFQTAIISRARTVSYSSIL